jgi:sulfite reductase beta subunit-like hemoprotein
MAPGTKLGPAVHVAHDTPWERRDLLGVHPQKQEGLSWVGVSVPSGRITAQDLEVRPHKESMPALHVSLSAQPVRQVIITVCTTGSECVR